MTGQAPVSGGDMREQLAEVVDRHLTEQDYSTGCPLSCGYDGDDRATHIADALLPFVQRIADERAADVEHVMEAQYRTAWAAWEATVDERDKPTVESRIAWARMNQALDDQNAVAAHLRAATSRQETGR